MNQLKDFIEYVFNVFKIWVIIQPWEQGLIVRKGTKSRKVNGGMYFKIPYIDSVYVQETRTRMVTSCLQTLTTGDAKTITLNSAFGYRIEDLERLYASLYHPEGTLTNMIMGYVSDYIWTNQSKDITPAGIECAVLTRLNITDYGLTFEYFKITNFAAVRTFRLIQDNQSWVDNGLKLDDKK